MHFLALAAALVAFEGGPPSGDQAQVLVGTWNCETYAGSISTQTFTRDPSGTQLTLDNKVELPTGVPIELRETYAYDAASNTWTYDSPASALWGAAHGTSGPWLQRRWVFTGRAGLLTTYGQIVERPIRMIYTMLGPDAIRRQHQIQDDGAWRNYSEAVCTRGRN